MNTMQKLLTGATLLVAGITLGPEPAFAAEEEQTVVCTTTIIYTTTTVTETATGRVISVTREVSIKTECEEVAN